MEKLYKNQNEQTDDGVLGPGQQRRYDARDGELRDAREDHAPQDSGPLRKLECPS